MLKGFKDPGGEASMVPPLISSHTAGADYLPVNEKLLFTSEADPVRCFDVYVINDSMTEKEENFTILLSTSSSQLLVGGTASVRIVDDDLPSEPLRNG